MAFIRPMAILILLVVSLAPSTAGAKGGRMPTLYMLEPQFGRVLQPLDPATLQPSYFGPGIIIGDIGNSRTPAAQPTMLISSSGTMLARAVDRCSGCQSLHAKYITIRIVDLYSGQKVAQFHPHVAMLDFGYLSNDGKVLAGFQQVELGSTTGLRWTAISTKTGRMLHRFALSTTCCGPTFYDASTDRFYATEANAEHQLELHVYAGASSSSLGDLTLPNVSNGTWHRAGENFMHTSQPGVAMSPDGSHLAVYDGAAGTVTMVALPAMKVISTLSVSQPESVLQRIGDALGLSPTVADAKGPPPVGTDFSARFSRDGRSLFVTGSHSVLDGQGKAAWIDSGLTRIDLATGHIMANLPDAGSLRWWAEAGDGSAIYTLSTEVAGELCPCVLESHDPFTLQTTAQRELTGPLFDTNVLPQLFIFGKGGTI